MNNEPLEGLAGIREGFVTRRSV